MKPRLVNARTDNHEMTVGTCELCEFTTDYDFTTLIFEKNGREHDVDCWLLSCGWMSEIYIQNIPHFAKWLFDKPESYFNKQEHKEFSYDWLEDIVDDYDDELDAQV